MLLHLAHPLALKSLSSVLTHIKNLRAFMASLPAGAEGPRIAKDVLMNIVACSGFDIVALCTFLDGCVEESASFSGVLSILAVHRLPRVDELCMRLPFSGGHAEKLSLVPAHIRPRDLAPQDHPEADQRAYH